MSKKKPLLEDDGSDNLGVEVAVVRTGKRYAKKDATTPTTKGKKPTAKTPKSGQAVGKAVKPKTPAKGPAPASRPVGRPPVYNAAKHPQQAFEMALLKINDAGIARIIGIDHSTFNNWKVTREEFSKKLNEGREAADGRVARSLYERAVGYSHPDVDIKMYKGEIIETPIIKHYPPDTAAALTWLKNRRPHDWRDRTTTEVVGLDDGPIQQVVGTATDYAAIRAKVKERKEKQK